MNGRRSRIVRRSLALALTAKPAAVGILALTPQAASAANPPPVACASGGLGLKAAIASANASGGTVTLASGCTYTLATASSPNEGLPLITGTVVVNGNGATITRGGAVPFRIFHVKPGGDLTLQNVTVSNGLTVNSVGGAGIFNELGKLTVTASTISGNRATATLASLTSKGNNATGGGILTSGTTTITNTRVTGNKATAVNNNQTGEAFAFGGGIAAKGGRLTVVNSTLSQNTASVAATGGGAAIALGGGISGSTNIFGTASLTMTISSSTLSGNQATANSPAASNLVLATGGAIELVDFNSTPQAPTAFGAFGAKAASAVTFAPVVPGTQNATIINSTIAANSATSTAAIGPGGQGGAIGEIGLAADKLTVVNSTIARNTTGGPRKTSGTVDVNGTGSATLTNTIIASNSGANCQGKILDAGGNISFPAPDKSCPATFAQGDPVLGPLQNNGGPTETMALGTGSAAIDTAFAIPCGQPSPGGAGGVDQRGLPRMEVLADPKCDIGAFEVQPVVAVLPVPKLPKAGTPVPGGDQGLPWPLIVPAAMAAAGALGAAGRGLRGQPKN